MEFMLMSAESVGISAELIYLQALIAWRGEKDIDKHIKLLMQCKDKQIEMLNASRHPKNTFDWYTAFNPHLLLDVCLELLHHCGVSPLMPSEAKPAALKEA